MNEREELLVAGLEALLAAVHADDPKREILIRVGDAIREVRTLGVAQGVGHCGKPDPAAQFVMWALMEGSWQGSDVDGGAAQDKAVDLGLIVKTAYDPAKHGKSGDSEPGDDWYVPSPTLIAALESAPSSPAQSSWQPIDTAPKDGTNILVTMAGGTDGPYYVLFWNDNFFESLESGEGPNMGHLTHWQPLQMPPASPLSSTEPLPPDWKQDQAETSRLAPRVSSTQRGGYDV